ncbi:MAG: 5-oxoprolinase subunit PxpB [Bacteroidota bacterium]
MVHSTSYQIYAIGDQGISLDYGGEISESVNSKIFKLFQLLKDWQPEAVLDIIPAYHSISLIYDFIKIKKLAGSNTAYSYLETKLRQMEAQLTDTNALLAQRKIDIPVCYDLSVAPDLEELATSHELTVKAFIEFHIQKSYRVYMIGFMPGFAYMGTVDQRIISPRKANPRTHVPAGSVGIAGAQTGIYPFDSPGGWQIIGQTPVLLFDANKEKPTLLEPGDEVMFHPISLDEFHHLKKKSS